MNVSPDFAVANIAFGVGNIQFVTLFKKTLILRKYGGSDMVTGGFDLDDDGKKDVIIKGGILALIAIVIIADLMITGGQFTLEVIAKLFTAISNL